MKTGITVSQNVISRFNDAGRNGGDRLIKVELANNDEVLDLVTTEGASADWEADFDKVPHHLQPKQACFVIYRTDKQNSEGRYLWYLLCFVPDDAKVKYKMLYASTRHPLRHELGQYNIIDEIHGTDPKDFSSKGFQEYFIAKTSEAPLTESERLKKEEQEASYQDYIVGTAGTLPSPGATRGVSFPVDANVLSSFDSMKNGSINYMRLVIDFEAELIKLDHAGSVGPAELGPQVPIADCAFHFYMWSHMHEGQKLNTLIFAFSCPDGSGGSKSAPVRSRTLYASSKNNVATIPTQRGLEVSHRMDIANAADFAQNEYANEIHPPPVVAQTGFKKPAAPGRGAKRL